jgi:hypothetical protein
MVSGGGVEEKQDKLSGNLNLLVRSKRFSRFYAYVVLWISSFRVEWMEEQTPDCTKSAPDPDTQLVRSHYLTLAFPPRLSWTVLYSIDFLSKSG